MGLRSLVLALLATVAVSDARAQSLEVRPEQTRAGLGDPITLRITVRLPPGMELIDAVPHPLVPPPRGIRVLSTDSLRRVGSGELTGNARVAFYRIGTAAGTHTGTAVSHGAGKSPGHAGPLARLGRNHRDPARQEIRRSETFDRSRRSAAPVWAPLVLLAALIGAGFWWLRRKSRLGDSAARRLDLPAPPGAFDVALARLAEIERVARASGNGVVPLYADVAEVVRSCLLEVGALPHTGLTTREVGELLPAPYAVDGLGARCATVLGDARPGEVCESESRSASPQSDTSRAPVQLAGIVAGTRVEPRSRRVMRFATPWFLVLLVVPLDLLWRPGGRAALGSSGTACVPGAPLHPARAADA